MKLKLKQVKILTPLNLTPVDDVLFKLGSDLRVDFVTDEGIWRLHNQKDWLTDLRSGSDAINTIVPKWGTPIYTAGILMHDTAFSGWMSFELANEMLAQTMVLSKDVGRCRAWLATAALNQFGYSHYSQMDMPLQPPYGGNRALESLILVDR